MTAKKEKGTGVTRGGVLRLIVFLGIGFFFIYWFLLKLDAGQKAAIWASFTGANYWWVAATMACCLLSHLVRALRWRLLFEQFLLRALFLFLTVSPTQSLELYKFGSSCA